MPEQPSFQRHPDDKGVDEILFVDRLATTVEDAQQHAFMRIALVERYKTSGMSGDEWRFSAGLYVREGRRRDWRLISTKLGLDAMCAALYPSLYGDFRSEKWTAEFVKRKVGNVVFSWKGHPVWACSYDGEATEFMVAAGHLPWAWMCCGDQGSDPSPLKAFCCQPGCSRKLTSIYRLKHRYCQWGHKSDPMNGRGFFDARGFCDKHLRRGDCGLDDADHNYEVVSGSGPDGHEPDPNVVKEAAFGGTIEMSPEDLG